MTRFSPGNHVRCVDDSYSDALETKPAFPSGDLLVAAVGEGTVRIAGSPHYWRAERFVPVTEAPEGKGGA